jgi:chaperonin GroEL (HSP60 family)
MVMVVDDAIVQVKKKGKAVTETKYYPGFMFDELGV